MNFYKIKPLAFAVLNGFWNRLFFGRWACLTVAALQGCTPSRVVLPSRLYFTSFTVALHSLHGCATFTVALPSGFALQSSSLHFKVVALQGSSLHFKVAALQGSCTSKVNSADPSNFGNSTQHALQKDTQARPLQGSCTSRQLHFKVVALQGSCTSR